MHLESDDNQEENFEIYDEYGYLSDRSLQILNEMENNGFFQ